eukprot:2838594-Rhodomonas_salina.1
MPACAHTYNGVHSRKEKQKTKKTRRTKQRNTKNKKKKKEPPGWSCTRARSSSHPPTVPAPPTHTHTHTHSRLSSVPDTGQGFGRSKAGLTSGGSGGALAWAILYMATMRSVNWYQKKSPPPLLEDRRHF